MKKTVYGILAVALTSPVLADPGLAYENSLQRLASFSFGVSNDIGASALTPAGYLRNPAESATDLLKHSASLQVEFVTRDAAQRWDLMVLYPTANPTHIIGCIESGVATLADGRKNPSVQAVDLATGTVSTILRGMSNCDGLTTTPWDSVLATEETGNGMAYEIFDPLNTLENTVTDRASGTISGPTADHIAQRPALPKMAWEGVAVLDSGVVIGGDELRPGSYANDQGSKDTDGGGMFKFVPATLYSGIPVSSPAQSPLVAGTVYALQVSCVNSTRQYGQGCEVGNAAWVQVNAADARADANRKGATGYYRPEDLHQDPNYTGEGVRFCWSNTGNESSGHYAEIMCAVDKKPNEVVENGLNVMVNRFVEGNPDMNSFDSFEFQPGTGIHYIVEDRANGDVWACLPDGADRDIKSDGCIKVLSVMDKSAEPTGFFFSPDGKTAYLSIQHSADAPGMEHDGYPTDDLLKISGFGDVYPAAQLQALLDFRPGQASVVDSDSIRIENFTFNGTPLSVNLKINLDGTWEIR